MDPDDWESAAEPVDDWEASAEPVEAPAPEGEVYNENDDPIAAGVAAFGAAVPGVMQFASHAAAGFGLNPNATPEQKMEFVRSRLAALKAENPVATAVGDALGTIATFAAAPARLGAKLAVGAVQNLYRNDAQTDRKPALQAAAEGAVGAGIGHGIASGIGRLAPKALGVLPHTVAETGKRVLDTSTLKQGLNLATMARGFMDPFSAIPTLAARAVAPGAARAAYSVAQSPAVGRVGAEMLRIGGTRLVDLGGTEGNAARVSSLALDPNPEISGPAAELAQAYSQDPREAAIMQRKLVASNPAFAAALSRRSP